MLLAIPLIASTVCCFNTALPAKLTSLLSFLACKISQSSLLPHPQRIEVRAVSNHSQEGIFRISRHSKPVIAGMKTPVTLQKHSLSWGLADIARAAEISELEAASYPADEAATLAQIRMRIQARDVK